MSSRLSCDVAASWSLSPFIRLRHCVQSPFLSHDRSTRTGRSIHCPTLSRAPQSDSLLAVSTVGGVAGVKRLSISSFQAVAIIVRPAVDQHRSPRPTKKPQLDHDVNRTRIAGHKSPRPTHVPVGDAPHGVGVVKGTKNSAFMTTGVASSRVACRWGCIPPRIRFSIVGAPRIVRIHV